MKDKMTRVQIIEKSGDKIVRHPRTCFRCGKKKLTGACKFGSIVIEDNKILRINWASFCSDCTKLIRAFCGVKKEKS